MTRLNLHGAKLAGVSPINRSLWLSFGLVAFSVLGQAATTVTCVISPTSISTGNGTATLSCPAIDAGGGSTIGSLELVIASDYLNGPNGTVSGTTVSVTYVSSANFTTHTDTISGGFQSNSSSDMTDGVPNPGFANPAQTINVAARTLAAFTIAVTSSVTGGPVEASSVNAFLIYTPTTEVITVTCAAVSSGEVGVPFSSGPITVNGGVAPFTFSVATGALPSGLTLDPSTGAITGTPTSSGTFTIHVTDSIGGVSSNSCPFTIISGPFITCPLVSSFEVGVPVNSPAIVVSGGTPPYTFSVATGSLPNGLTLNPATGAITGTATAAGSFTIQVKDSLGVATTVNCPFTVSAGPAITCPAINTFEVGEPVNSPAIAVIGGVGPYTFSVATGSLPSGLTLNTLTGAITGTPTATGTFTIQVKDSLGAVATTTCPFTVTGGPTLTCPTGTSGEVGLPFTSSAITISGGIGPYTFSVATGTLPGGLTLNPTTGAITGTPTSAGSFTVQVTDSFGAVSLVNCPFTIAPPPSLSCPTVEAFQIGVPVNSPAINVTGGGGGPYTFSVATGSLPPGLTLNTSTGAITGTPSATGNFTIQVTDKNGIVSSNSCPFSVNSNVSYLVKYAANLNIGESYIEITDTGAYGAPPLGPGLGSPVGNLCVNVYAFDPNEELISCCSCLLTADQTVNLGVNLDLVDNTLTGEHPTAVTVKLLPTLAGGDSTGTSCAYSAGTVTSGVLASGLAAWGTTLHAQGGGGFKTTETPFTGSTLSPAELASLGARCSAIIGNASGAGICSSCQPGAH